jgi:hypothetical protein
MICTRANSGCRRSEERGAFLVYGSGWHLLVHTLREALMTLVRCHEAVLTSCDTSTAVQQQYDQKQRMGSRMFSCMK